MPKDLDLFSTKDEEIYLISRDLLQQGCCPRCMLRFLGERKPSAYSLSEEELYSQYLKPGLDQETATDLEQKVASLQKCPACVGILQEFACTNFYQQVLEKVKEEDYEFTDYQFSLILPAATIVRQHAVFVYLVQKYESVYKHKEDTIASIKDVFKWCAGIHFPQLLGVPFKKESSFDILLTLTYEPSDQECRFLLDTFPDTFRRRKVNKGTYETFSRASVQKVLGEMKHSDFSRKFSCPPSVPTKSCKCDISVSHDSVFVAGRYMKYSRALSQTPWIINGVAKMEDSVQELVCQVILERFKPSGPNQPLTDGGDSRVDRRGGRGSSTSHFVKEPEDHKFSASGREDVDVQMLGMGRPFVVELINPHRIHFSPEDLRSMQQETNARTQEVAVRDLQMVTSKDTQKLKEGEEDKSKSYKALCWCQRPLTLQDREMLDNTKDLVLYQKTPIRVLHRRTLATRERKVFTMKVEPAEGLQFKLHLNTQAGTYVKEFVHGDFGRTQPNMRTLLGADCDILALDVTAVNVDWPARIDPVPEDVAENGGDQETSGNHQQPEPDNAGAELQRNKHEAATNLESPA